MSATKRYSLYLPQELHIKLEQHKARYERDKGIAAGYRFSFNRFAVEAIREKLRRETVPWYAATEREEQAPEPEAQEPRITFACEEEANEEPEADWQSDPKRRQS